MKKITAGVAAAAAALMLTAGFAQADDYVAGIEGCVVGTGADIPGAAHATSCTFTAKRPGGYLAQGSWTYSITRTVGAVTTTSTYTQASANAPEQGCMSYIPGDVISVSIPSAGAGVIAAGQPTPSDAQAGEPCA